jgi:protein disulfide isomerase
LGVNTANSPAVLYLGAKNDKYVYDQDEITAENLGSFLDRVKAGEVEQFLKSAEIPESNDAPVKIIVGKTFNDIVLNNEKEVLVKFYAPWCGHCKTIAPHFDEAAERLANNPNIVIAKVDSTENEVSAVDIQGFPTLKFWGKDKSQPPIDFNGERTADGIIQWLKDHTSYEWIESGEAAAAEAEL